MDSRRRSLAWAPPAALAAIAIVTLAGLIVPLVISESIGDAFVQNGFLVVLTLVSVAALVQNRFFVLPAILSGRAQRGQAAPATLEERERSAMLIACTFSVSNAVYGVVAAILLDNSLWALPFGALGLISMAVTVPHVRARMGALYRERSVAGDP